MANSAGARIIQIGILCGVAILDTVHATAADQTELAVLIANNGRVDGMTLARAQSGATHVLHQAGVRIRWLECSLAEGEQRDSSACQLPLGVLTVILKILPQDPPERWRMAPRILGLSQDQDIYIFLPRVELLAAAESVSRSTVLGPIIAHEIGHALLGPGHSTGGVMRNGFCLKELRLAEKGQLQFLPKEALRIRQRIRVLSQAHVNPQNQTSTRSRAAASTTSTSR